MFSKSLVHLNQEKYIWTVACANSIHQFDLQTIWKTIPVWANIPKIRKINVCYSIEKEQYALNPGAGFLRIFTVAFDRLG